MTNDYQSFAVELSIEEIDAVNGAGWKAIVKAAAEFAEAVAEGWALAHA